MAEAGGSFSHFSHPGHELVKRHYTGPSILCDMCWELLSGLAYGCRAGCNFVIHDACAGHPQTLSSPAHHPHQLVLVQTRRRGDVARICDVCAGRCAAGCFLYRCPPCGFAMHPRCARLPLAVRSSRHHPAAHDLTLVADEGRCAACHHGGRAWYYRCTVCSNLDLHVSCAAGERDAVPAGHVGNGHAPVTRDLHGEVIRVRIQALQGAMGYAPVTAIAGTDLLNFSSDFHFYVPTRRYS
ncbi:hypothetical protein HU200_046102 [Digitaria exilis]|uniref:DC1 domain-containing protein n=1 Tax=Digitaria exilis TaxID=1010633 RepID=A0A835E9Z7_9POAL|nr:hypothetical protein HU200_046102 [Digitaria exilis]